MRARDDSAALDDGWAAFRRRRPRARRPERAWTNAIGGAAVPIAVHAMAWSCYLASVTSDWDRPADRAFVGWAVASILEVGLVGACLPLGVVWVVKGGFDRIRGVALLAASVIGGAGTFVGTLLL